MNTTHKKGAPLNGTPSTPRDNFTTSLNQVEQALTFIDASERDTWVNCGMGIKAEFNESGFDVWDGGFKFEVQQLMVAWCSTSPLRIILHAVISPQALCVVGG